VSLRAVPAWAWIVALVPLAIVGLGVASRLSVYGLRKHLARAQAETSAESAPPPASFAQPTATLTGEAVDLSAVMGRARKLAERWQPEAALLGIEAVLLGGKIQTQDGASAKLSFGPGRFASKRQRAELFVVTYDKAGLSGAPAPGRAGKALPEPMCAPEHVLLRLSEQAGSATVLRYGYDDDERALWFANPAGDPKNLRVFDAQDCRLRGNVVVVPRSRR
jgi:hypothetical protein